MSPRDGERTHPPLSTMARAILTEFANAFPESAHYRGGRTLRKGGWERVFPRIRTDVEQKEAFLDAVDELVSLGVLSVKWARFRDGTEVEALYLEDPDRLFELVNRSSPDAVRAEMLELLDSEVWRSADAGSPHPQPDALTAVREHLRASLDARHPVPVDDAAALRDLARLLRVDPDEARASPIRALSVRVFGDSKRLESLLPVADTLARRALGAPLSATLGLARSYPEASLALCGALVFGAPGRRRWEVAGEAMTLPAETIAQLEAVEIVPAKPGPGPGGADASPAILSVENKETFHTLAVRLRAGTLPGPFRAVAYCGGHPHRPYIDLLGRISQSGVEIHHFGDFDPDGVFIFAELADALAAELHPFLMTVDTYARYLPYGYDPSPARLQLLSSRLPDLPPTVRPLAAEIVKRGKGVEQEVVSLETVGNPTRCEVPPP